MFSQSDTLALKTYCQSITIKPRRFDQQSFKREGVFLWCDDWEIIEILKYLFHGKEVYYGDPPPNRLKNNPLWSKEDIEKKAESLIAEFKTSDAIIENLKQRRDLNVRTA